MAKFSHAESRRMYSWWWDSHISPKNSKWLQENLTDMDAKVKGMIKLIEEDADSFARRAEMYYKKRPELMKMVEDFYRAYRALAERYDHATGVIRHAHRTMTEAFPNQVPSMFADDSPVSSGPGADPRTREMSPPVGESIGESESVTGHKAMKAFKDPFGHARRELNFDDVEEKENGKDSNQNNYEKDPNSSKSNKETEEIQKLKEALTKLEAEKEAGLVQYQQSLDKLSQLQAEFSKTSEDFKILSDHANKAENEVSILKEAITKLESERESRLKDYQLCVDKISNLQKVISTTQEDSQKLNERASTAENEVQSLKGELDKLAAEKDEALNKYVQSLETISNLENKLRLTEEDFQRLKERAERAESEVESLRQTISKLTEEKEATALQYQQCLEAISSLEEKLTASQEEAKRLNVEVDNGVMKLKSAEEQCLLLERSNQSLHSELESLMLKMGTQTQELTEKQKELGGLWACIQEERLRFVEAETAFQTLQHLHAQTQEELRGVASELQNRTQLLNAMETQINNLHDEVLKVKQENKQLDEVNASSALSIKDMQNEISSLMESKGKLQEEVELRLDERNALQQEIYCLKEELNDVSKKHNTILNQVNAVGLNPESLESSLKKLQDENSSLKDTCHRDSIEKAALLVKLERLLEKNSLLETSLSDLNAELEAVRGKLEALEQSCQSLLREKSTLDDENSSLTAQLHEAKMNLEKLSENNTVLENSIADAHHQLEALKAKSRTLEDSCQFLVDEKAGLISANDGLTAQLESTNLKLADLGKLYGELEGRCSTLEKENESTLLNVEELQKSLLVERREHANYLQMSETRFSGIEAEMNCLKEESECRKRELDQMLDNAIVNEIEIFVLRVTAQEMKENNYLLSMKNQKLLDESSVSEKKISQLERNNFQQQAEIKFLSDRTGRLRTGAYKLLKVFNIVGDYAHDNNSDQDLVYLDQLLIKLQKMEESLRNTEYENLELTVKLSVLIAWLRQLYLDSRSLDVEKKKVDSDLKVKTEQVLVMQSEALKLHEMNEELRSKMREEECNKEALMTKIEGLNNKMMAMQGTCQVLQEEKLKIIKEKESLTHNLLFLEEKNSTLEEENYGLCDKVLALENLSLIFRTFADEKSMVFRELGDDRNKLHDMNSALIRNLSSTEGSLNESKTENHHLKERLREVQEESKAIVAVKDQLTIKIENGKKQVAEMALELQKAEEKMNLVEKEKLVLIGCVGESKTENHHLKERLQEVQDELKDVAAVKDQFAIEIENGKKQVAEMVLELQKAEDKINLVEKEKLVLIASVGESKAENHHLKERLHEAQDELNAVATVKDQLAMEIENGKKQMVEMALELQKAEEKINLREKEKLELNESVEGSKTENDFLKESLQKVQDELKTVVTVKDELAVEIENGKKQVAGMALELQKADEKMNLVEKEKLVLIGCVGESKTENQYLMERLQAVQDELKAVEMFKDQLAVEIENKKKQVTEMEVDLQNAERKINLAEKEKLELNESMEDLRNKYDEVKLVHDQQENQILKLSADNDYLSRDGNCLRETCQKLEVEWRELQDENDKRRTQEENLHSELQTKLNEIDKVETQAATVFGQLQYSLVNQVVYEQKFHEVHEEFLGYMDQTDNLKTQLGAYGPEIASLKECISSLENHTDIHVKFQNPENEDLQGAQSTKDSCEGNVSDEHKLSKENTFSDLRDLRVRLQAIVKAAVEIKELMVQENFDLHAKLNASTRQLELLQSEIGQHRRTRRPTSEITEADSALLTKDIMLDQISDGSSHRFSKMQPVDPDNQIIELWETGDPDGTVGLTVKTKKLVSPSTTTESTDSRRAKSMKKQKGVLSTSGSLIEDDWSVDKLENSKRSTDPLLEGNRRKVLERLDSDVQKLANLQITVQDLKRKLEVIEKKKRGKAVIECEALKGQLEEADIAVIKLFDLNARLMKNIDDRSFSDTKSSSFDQEDDAANTRRRKVSENARRMSEKIGRLQLEVQKLQFVLLKLDDENEGRSKISEARRRILLRDYLYGGRTGQRRKKGNFCACIQASSVKE